MDVICTSAACGRLDAGDAVHVEHIVKVAYNLGLEVDSSLNLALGNTLHGLTYCTDNANILTVETHPCYLDVE